MLYSRHKICLLLSFIRVLTNNPNYDHASNFEDSHRLFVQRSSKDYHSINKHETNHVSVNTVSYNECGQLPVISKR